MRCMKKIDEAFNEDDHPRGQPDNDGQFVASGTGSKTKTKRKTKTSKPKQSDSAFSWRDISKPLSTKQKFNYRSRSHDIKVYRSRGKNYPQTINISKATNPEYVRAFTGFWNTDPSIKAMIKHIDYLGLEYQNNPKRGGVWYGDDKKVIIYDYPYQSLGHFKSTTVHEIVGHTFWDLAREYFRNDLIEFNELANKMPPVNQYCKDNEEKWKSWNDEKRSQISALDKKYGVTKDEYGYTDASTQLWGEDADKYQEAINKINDGKFIGNPSNEFMNRDSSSMTRYANEQHSAITEIMYGTLKDSSDEGAKEVLIGKEDLDRMKVLWLKLHPKFPQKAGESWNPFNEELTMRCMKKVGGNEAETLSVIRLVSSEAFQEQEHPRDGDGKFSTKGGGGSPKSDILKKYLKKIPLSIPDKHNNKSIPLIKETDYLVDNKPSFITSDGIYLSNDIMRGWEYPESHADILGHITGLNLKDIDTDKTAKVAGELNLVRVLIDTELTIHVTSKLSRSQLNQINKLVKEWTGEVDIEYDIGTDGGLDRFGTDDRKEFQNKLREKGWMAEAFVEQEHPRDGGGKFAKKGSVKSDKETVDKVIDKIKNTWDDVSPTVHGSHFLTPNGEIIGNYNHNTMVTDLAPMIDGFELTGKIIHGGGRLKNMETGEWYDEEKTIESYAGWKDITKFLGKTGFVRATNEGKSESGYGHTINLTVNGTLTSSQIRAIQKMEKQSAGGTTLNFDIMGDETQSGHGTFRDFMKAYRSNYGIEAFVELEHPRDPDGEFTAKGGAGKPKYDNKTLTSNDSQKLEKGLKKHFETVKEPKDIGKNFLTTDGEWIQLNDGDEHWIVLPAILGKFDKDKQRNLPISQYLTHGIVRGGFEKGVVFINAKIPLNSKQQNALELVMIKKGLTTDNLVTEFPDEFMDKQFKHKLRKGIGEAFVEDEHPRDEDGQFTGKDTIPALSQPSHSKVSRDDMHTKQINYWKGINDAWKKEVSNIPRRIERIKNSTTWKGEFTKDSKIRELVEDFKKAQNFVGVSADKIDKLKNEINVLDKLGLYERELTVNTHKEGVKGFKNGITNKELVKAFPDTDWKSDTPTMMGDMIDGNRIVRYDDYMKVTGGKTIIKSSINSRSSDEIKELNNEVMRVWNDLFTDEDRSLVDVFTVTYSDVSFKGIRTAGEMGKRGMLDNKMLYQSRMNMLLQKDQSKDDVVGIMFHELNHAKWNGVLDTDKEKIDRFTDKIISEGKENAITGYVAGEWEKLDVIKKSKRFKNEKQRSSAIRRQEISIANETHSEYFGILYSPYVSDYHQIDTDKLVKTSDSLKEFLYD